MYRYKLEWFRRLKEYFARRFSTRMKLVWTGDINVAPRAMDIHNAEQQTNHVCYHVDARKAFADVVSWGFVDVFRKHRPQPGEYSFFDYRTPNAAKRKMGWRIDHILATRSLARRSSDAFVDLEPRLGPRPSDHTFVVADFDV
jgi:exodeoxyribonuclease-3